MMFMSNISQFFYFFKILFLIIAHHKIIHFQWCALAIPFYNHKHQIYQYKSKIYHLEQKHISFESIEVVYFVEKKEKTIVINHIKNIRRVSTPEKIK